MSVSESGFTIILWQGSGCIKVAPRQRVMLCHLVPSCALSLPRWPSIPALGWIRCALKQHIVIKL